MKKEISPLVFKLDDGEMLVSLDVLLNPEEAIEKLKMAVKEWDRRKRRLSMYEGIVKKNVDEFLLKLKGRLVT